MLLLTRMHGVWKALEKEQPSKVTQIKRKKKIVYLPLKICKVIREENIPLLWLCFMQESLSNVGWSETVSETQFVPRSSECIIYWKGDKMFSRILLSKN